MLRISLKDRNTNMDKGSCTLNPKTKMGRDLNTQKTRPDKFKTRPKIRRVESITELWGERYPVTLSVAF